MRPCQPLSLSRRQFAGIVTAATAAAAVGGCSTNSSNKSRDTLKVWGGVPLESGPQQLIDKFQKKHPEISVKYTRFVNDDRGNLKLNTALQGDVDIDVFFTYEIQDLAMRASSGLAADVGDRVRETPEFSGFLDRQEPKALIDGDEITALATTREPNMILINSDLRQRAGIDLPAEWTIKDYLDVLRELSSDRTYGTYTLPDMPRITLGPNYWYTKSGNSNFSHPAFLEHLALSAKLIREGVLYPWSQAIARQVEVYQQNNFIDEDFAVWTTAPYSLRFLTDQAEYPHDFQVECAPMPTIDGSDWNTGTYGNFIQINAKSPKQDMAWEFCKFWLIEGGHDMATGGKIPTLDTVEHDTLLGVLLGEDADSAFDVASFRRTLFDNKPRLHMDTVLTAYTEINQKYEQQRDVCWLLERSPEDAIGNIDKNAQALIDRFEED